ncbi:MAG: phage tail assembly protein [Planctomycetota bacterium]
MTEATTPIPLSKPISIGGETVTELLMEELRAEHLMELPTGREPNVGELLRVAAAASGKPFGLLKRLGFDDTQAVIEHLGRAMSPFP